MVGGLYDTVEKIKSMYDIEIEEFSSEIKQLSIKKEEIKV